MPIAAAIVTHSLFIVRADRQEGLAEESRDLLCEDFDWSRDSTLNFVEVDGLPAAAGAEDEEAGLGDLNWEALAATLGLEGSFDGNGVDAVKVVGLGLACADEEGPRFVGGGPRDLVECQLFPPDGDKNEAEEEEAHEAGADERTDSSPDGMRLGVEHVSEEKGDGENGDAGEETEHEATALRYAAKGETVACFARDSHRGVEIGWESVPVGVSRCDES
jgi:hypothetical protein